MIISGAFGLFRRDALRAIGGYQVDSIGEDMELVVRLRRAGLERRGASRVVFVPEPVAWTEAPESLRVLGRQRDRWQRGLVDVLWRHRRLVFNPHYGTVGLVVTPYFVLVELLGPVIEALGVLGLAVGVGLHLVALRFALLFFLIVYGWGLLFSIGALLLDELTNRRYEGLVDRLLLVCWALIEPLGYRQLSVVWQLRGMVRAARRRSDWGICPGGDSLRIEVQTGRARRMRATRSAGRLEPTAEAPDAGPTLAVSSAVERQLTLRDGRELTFKGGRRPNTTSQT